MNGSSTYGTRAGGRRVGGPLLLLAALLLGACGSRGPAATPTPGRSPGTTELLDVYKSLGLLAGNAEFPGVASFSTLAGPGDSTYVLVGISMPASALRFQRERDGFRAEYEVKATFRLDGAVVKTVDRRAAVRVPTFAETSRTDESVIFQAVTAVPPGHYDVELEVLDGMGTRGFRASDSLEVPRYGLAAGHELSAPLLVFRARGRSSRQGEPDLILNPRRTVPYGGDVPRLYLEGYGERADRPVTVRLVDDTEDWVWEQVIEFGAGSGDVRHALVDIPVDALPLGTLWLEVAPENGSAPARTPLVITISDNWMVTNFEEVLELLAYIAWPAELDSLKNTDPVERRELWERFWDRRDPLPATPVNEFRDRFFERVRVATHRFRDAGQLGWRTDRGEVFIVMGPPDHEIERHVGRDRADGNPNAVEWIYTRAPGGRVAVTFVDRTGFGRYELTPQSRSAFESAANRLRPPRREE